MRHPLVLCAVLQLALGLTPAQAAPPRVAAPAAEPPSAECPGATCGQCVSVAGCWWNIPLHRCDASPERCRKCHKVEGDNLLCEDCAHDADQCPAAAAALPKSNATPQVRPPSPQHPLDMLPPEPVSLVSLTLNAHSVQATKALIATVTLDKPAPMPVVVHFVASDPALLTAPAETTIAKGADHASITVRAGNPSSRADVQLVAVAGRRRLVESIAVTAGPAVASVVLDPPGPLEAGQLSNGTVTLVDPAPRGGVRIALTAGPDKLGTLTILSTPPPPAPGSPQPSGSAANSQPTVFIPEGQTAGFFTVQAKAAATTDFYVVHALIGGASKSVMVTVNAAPPSTGTSGDLQKITLNKTSVRFGELPIICTVHLSGPAPANGLTFPVSVDKPAAKLALSSITIPGGQRDFGFPITANEVSGDTYVTVQVGTNRLLTASQARLTVKPIGVREIHLSRTDVTENSYGDLAHGNPYAGALTGTVLLTARAPQGGKVVPLQLLTDLKADKESCSQSTDWQRCDSVQIPKAVTVPAGATSVDFDIIVMGSGFPREDRVTIAWAEDPQVKGEFRRHRRMLCDARPANAVGFMGCSINAGSIGRPGERGFTPLVPDDAPYSGDPQGGISLQLPQEPGRTDWQSVQATPGQTFKAKVRLDTAAPVGGYWVNLWSGPADDDTRASVQLPWVVFIPEGQGSADFDVTVDKVANEDRIAAQRYRGGDPFLTQTIYAGTNINKASGWFKVAMPK